MIRAEDYVNQLDGCGIGHDKRCSCDRCFRGKKIALLPEDIKAIQLEAWKQGMTDAAEIASDWWYGKHGAEKIRDVRDAKTEL